MNHFILDFETLGQSVIKAPAINVAYYIFDFDKMTSDVPYTFKQLIKDIKFVKFDIKDQMSKGCSFKQRDIDWWEEQGSFARAQLKPTTDDVKVGEFIKSLVDYIGNTNLHRWWSRANTFDPIILQRMFEQESSKDTMDKILSFWRVRDVRSYIDTRFDFKIKKNAFCPIEDQEEWDKYFIMHNPVHDIAADILRMQKIERLLSDKQ